MHCIIYAIKEKGRKTSVVQADSKVTLHTITSSFSLETSYESCFACQYLVLNRTNHKLRKKLIIKNADICPCDSTEFEHDIVH